MAGSCSDSVHELAGKPTQHPTNSPCMASYKDAASLLFLDLGLVFVLLPDLAHVCFSSSFAFICCCSFSKAAKATSCMVAAIPGDPRNGGACLGTLCYFLTLTMRECCCQIKTSRTKAMCVSPFTYFLSCPMSSTVRRWLRRGRLGRRLLLLGAAAFLFDPRPSLGAVSEPASGTFFVGLAFQLHP